MNLKSIRLVCLLLTVLSGVPVSGQVCSGVGAGLSWQSSFVENCFVPGVGTILETRRRQVNAYEIPGLRIYASNIMGYRGQGACLAGLEQTVLECLPAYSGPFDVSTATHHRMEMRSRNKEIPVLKGQVIPVCAWSGTGVYRSDPLPKAECPEPDDEDPTCEECDHGDDNTPIIVSARGSRIDLTSVAEGVNFDLNSDGIPERLPWTRGRSSDAFLAFDRNSNGSIDDGTELFGNYTPQSHSDDPNGFRALAAFDEENLGGNRDGVIDASDDIFADLRLWVDRNHDGRSQPRELVPVEESEIVAFSLDYRESLRRDEHGNLFKYIAPVRMASSLPARHRMFAVDVILNTAGLP